METTAQLINVRERSTSQKKTEVASRMITDLCTKILCLKELCNHLNSQLSSLTIFNCILVSELWKFGKL